MATRWTHMTMTVRDIGRSVDFYTSFCGLAVLRDRRTEGSETVWLGPAPAPGELPTFLLVIGRGEVTCTVDHLGFQCGSREEVDRIAESGRELGILVEPPTDSGVVGYLALLRDPDGHLVEFTHGQPIGGLS